MLKYISVDIETAGLDKDIHPVVEFAAVATDLGDPTRIEELDVLLIHDELIVQTWPLFHHQDIWEDMFQIGEAYRMYENGERGKAQEYLKDYYPGHIIEVTHPVEPDKPVFHLTQNGETQVACRPHQLLTVYLNWLRTLGYGFQDRVNIAGKNVAGFDIPFLKELGWDTDKLFRHRVIDPGPMYVTAEDRTTPDLTECCKRAGIEDVVSHRALDDARLVDRVIRNKLLNH